MDNQIIKFMDKVPDESRPGLDITHPGNAFITWVRIRGGRVDRAWSTGKMVRATKTLLKKTQDSGGVPQFIHQANCLCNDGHALAAIRAVENLAGMEPPRIAQNVRSLVQALRCIQEHLLHVYQFNLSDWACLERALRADPAKAARTDHRAGHDSEYFRAALLRLRALARGRGAGALWGGTGLHPDHMGDDQFHLTLHAHSLDALKAGAGINSALSLLGCKAKGFAAYKVGGLPETMDLGAKTRLKLRELLAGCLNFVTKIFLPDLERIARTHGHWAHIGAGRAFMSSGGYTRPFADGPLFPGGIVFPGSGECVGNESWVALSGRGKIIEEQPNWQPSDRERYRLNMGGSGLKFYWSGVGLEWLPVPRHDQEACEVGPLARILNAWIHGRDRVRRTMGAAMDNSGLTLASMNSTLGRCLARGVESVVLAQTALDCLDELEYSLARGEKTMCRDLDLPSSGQGTGRVEVPRGTLIHTIRLEKGRITAHHHLVPTLWNFSPRDSRGTPGPLETALAGTPVANPDKPLEVLRTVHALDPCNTCQVVIENADTGKTTVTAAK